MKKTLMVAALTGVFATAAHAQSSVTLYGLIDAGITYTNNQQGHSNWKATSGSVNGSRWGLRGSEDLGGGLKAIFTLENGFNIMNGTNGQGGREFGRQAFVGLSSDQFGAVTLGRQYDSVVDYLGPAGSDRHAVRRHAVRPPVRQRQPRQLVPRQQLGQVHERELRWLQVRRHVRLLERGRRLREQPRVQRRRVV